MKPLAITTIRFTPSIDPAEDVDQLRADIAWVRGDATVSYDGHSVLITLPTVQLPEYWRALDPWFESEASLGG